VHDASATMQAFFSSYILVLHLTLIPDSQHMYQRP
jgi:hypothetical protein